MTFDTNIGHKKATTQCGPFLRSETKKAQKSHMSKMARCIMSWSRAATSLLMLASSMSSVEGLARSLNYHNHTTSSCRQQAQGADLALHFPG